MSNFHKKAYAAIGCIHGASQYLPVKIRKMLYNALLLPHLGYCSRVGHPCNQTLAQSLERSQNYALRVIPHRLLCKCSPYVETSSTGLPFTNVARTGCCVRCIDVCSGRLVSNSLANLSRTHTSTHPSKGVTSCISPSLYKIVQTVI